MDFNIYELLYTLQTTHNALGVSLIAVGMIAGIISFFGGLFADSIKTIGVFLIIFFLSTMLMICGGILDFKLKQKLVDEYITKHNLNRCEVLRELLKFDEDNWLNVYYKECIKGGE